MAIDWPPDAIPLECSDDEGPGPVDTTRYLLEQHNSPGAREDDAMVEDCGCDGEVSWGPVPLSKDILHRPSLAQGGPLPCGDREGCSIGRELVQPCPGSVGAAWGGSASFTERHAWEGEEACSSDEPQEDGWDDIGGDDAIYYSSPERVEVAASSKEGLGVECGGRDVGCDPGPLDLRHQVLQQQMPPTYAAGRDMGMQYQFDLQQRPQQRRADACGSRGGNSDSQDNASGGNGLVVLEAEPWGWQIPGGSSGTGSTSGDALPKRAAADQRSQESDDRGFGNQRSTGAGSDLWKKGNPDFAARLGRDSDCVSRKTNDVEEMKVEAGPSTGCQEELFCREEVVVDITRIDPARQARLWQAIIAGQEGEGLTCAAKAKPKRQATLRAFFAPQQNLLP